MADRRIIDAECRACERLAFGPRAGGPFRGALLKPKGIDLAHVERVLHVKMSRDLRKLYDRPPVREAAQDDSGDDRNSVGGRKEFPFLRATPLVNETQQKHDDGGDEKFVTHQDHTSR